MVQQMRLQRLLALLREQLVQSKCDNSYAYCETFLSLRFSSVAPYFQGQFTNCQLILVPCSPRCEERLVYHNTKFFIKLLFYILDKSSFVCRQKMEIESQKSERSPPTPALSNAIPSIFKSGKMICYIYSYTLFKCFFGNDRVDGFERSTIFY